MNKLLTAGGDVIVHVLEVGEVVHWDHPLGNRLTGVIKKKPIGRGFYVDTTTHIWHLERLDNGAWGVTIGYRIEGETKC